MQLMNGRDRSLSKCLGSGIGLRFNIINSRGVVKTLQDINHWAYWLLNLVEEISIEYFRGEKMLVKHGFGVCKEIIHLLEPQNISVYFVNFCFTYQFFVL